MPKIILNDKEITIEECIKYLNEKFSKKKGVK